MSLSNVCLQNWCVSRDLKILSSGYGALYLKPGIVLCCKKLAASDFMKRQCGHHCYFISIANMDYEYK